MDKKGVSGAGGTPEAEPSANPPSQSCDTQRMLTLRKFEGECKELKGQIYDCSDERQVDQFTKTSEEIALYVRHTWKGGTEIWYVVTYLEKPYIAMPEDPPEGATKTQQRVWESKVDSAVAREKQLEENIRELYTLIWGQCTDVLRQKVMALPGHDKVRKNMDGLGLLKEIKGEMFRTPPVSQLAGRDDLVEDGDDQLPQEAHEVTWELTGQETGQSLEVPEVHHPSVDLSLLNDHHHASSAMSRLHFLSISDVDIDSNLSVTHLLEDEQVVDALGDDLPSHIDGDSKNLSQGYADMNIEFFTRDEEVADAPEEVPPPHIDGDSKLSQQESADMNIQLFKDEEVADVPPEVPPRHHIEPTARLAPHDQLAHDQSEASGTMNAWARGQPRSLAVAAPLVSLQHSSRRLCKKAYKHSHTTSPSTAEEIRQFDGVDPLGNLPQEICIVLGPFSEDFDQHLPGNQLLIQFMARYADEWVQQTKGLVRKFAQNCVFVDELKDIPAAITRDCMNSFLSFLERERKQPLFLKGLDRREQENYSTARYHRVGNNVHRLAFRKRLMPFLRTSYREWRSSQQVPNSLSTPNHHLGDRLDGEGEGLGEDTMGSSSGGDDLATFQTGGRRRAAVGEATLERTAATRMTPMKTMKIWNTLIRPKRRKMVTP